MIFFHKICKKRISEIRVIASPIRYRLGRGKIKKKSVGILLICGKRINVIKKTNHNQIEAGISEEEIRNNRKESLVALKKCALNV